MGKLNENQQKLSYDKIYHLFLLITLSSGHKFKLERNETVYVAPYTITSDTETKNVGTPNNTLNEFIDNGSKGDNFWNYDPQRKNCQDFCLSMLRSNGLLTSEIQSFIKQDAIKLLEGAPIAQKIAKGVTDFAGRLHILIHGASRPFRK